MATWNKYHQFNLDLGLGVHNLHPSTGHTLKIALCTAVPALNAGAVLGDCTEIGSYANVQENRELDITAYALNAGVAEAVITDYTITADGGAIPTFRYVVVYNDTPSSPADPLIGYIDYGVNLDLASGESLDIDFAAVSLTIT